MKQSCTTHSLTYQRALLAVTGLDPLDGELRHLEVVAEVDGGESVPLQQELPGRLGDCKTESVPACVNDSLNERGAIIYKIK